MSTANVLYMLAILGLVWGGFAYCLFLLATRRDADDSQQDPQRENDATKSSNDSETHGSPPPGLES